MKDILDILTTVIHPAYDKSVVDLGLIEDVKTETSNDGKVEKVKFKLVFKAPDALSGEIKRACEAAIQKALPGVKVSIMELVREKAAKNGTNINDLTKDDLGGIGKIIAVASGKGGVGKSTVSVNLAITLAKMGYKVGLADADVYGPSIPKMTHTEGEIPNVEFIYEDGYTDDGTAENLTRQGVANRHGKCVKQLIVPIEKYGVKWMSIGYFAAPEQALIWRGPMACNALKQMILQVKWGEPDFLLIDLPPGTGDIHITLVHDIPLTGAVIVTTPQDVALADVEKGINMYRNKDVNKPILGLVENMSWFTPAELPNNRYYIFGKDGGKRMADKYGVALLGQIPLVQSIRESGDEGEPAALKYEPVYNAFKGVADKLV